MSKLTWVLPGGLVATLLVACGGADGREPTDRAPGVERAPAGGQTASAGADRAGSAAGAEGTGESSEKLLGGYWGLGGWGALGASCGLNPGIWGAGVIGAPVVAPVAGVVGAPLYGPYGGVYGPGLGLGYGGGYSTGYATGYSTSTGYSTGYATGLGTYGWGW